jgi:hypothetical protein
MVTQQAITAVRTACPARVSEALPMQQADPACAKQAIDYAQ